MFGPGRHSEHDVIVGYLAEQLAAIRTAAYGLTDEQARATPCASTLSIGGLVKHACYVMDRRGAPTGFDAAGVALFVGSFALTEDETLEGVLARFDETRERYLADVRATDPGAEAVAPPAPWDGRPEPAESVERFALVHHIEEFARHAGHADIVREQLDGAQAASLALAEAGLPGNDFIQPWEPQPR